MARVLLLLDGGVGRAQDHRTAVEPRCPRRAKHGPRPALAGLDCGLDHRRSGWCGWSGAPASRASTWGPATTSAGSTSATTSATRSCFRTSRRRCATATGASASSTRRIRAVCSPGSTPSLDARGCVASRQLLLWGSAETYLRGGRFSPDWIAEFWEEQVRSAAADGYERARVFGEMSWAARVGLDRTSLVEYEAWAHRFAVRHGQVVLSLYDLGLPRRRRARRPRAHPSEAAARRHGAGEPARADQRPSSPASHP